MGIYSELENPALPTRIYDYLDNLGVPVRVLRGSAYTYNVSASWRGHARDNGTTIEECEANGITLVSWAVDSIADGANIYDYRSAIPGWFYEDGMDRNFGREWVRPGVYDERTLTTDDGTAFARIDERIVYYCLPLVVAGETSDWSEGLDLDRFFEEPIRQSQNLSEILAQERIRLESERTEREARLREEAATRARSTFIDSYGRGGASRIDTLRDSIRSWEANQVSYEASLRDCIAQRISAVQEIALLESGDGDLRTQAERTWDALMDHPKLKRIDVERGNYGSEMNLVLYTEGLDITHPETNETAYLGEMKITIPSNARRSIHFQNLDHTLVRRAHPHIDENGTACFGDMSSLVTELHSRNDIPGLLEILIQYLGSFNPDDSWGEVYGRYWFDNPPAPVPINQAPNYDRENNIDNEHDCDCDECRRERGEAF